MLLVILTYKKPRDIVDQYVEAHRNFLDQGYKKDYFIVSGPKNPRDGGIILSQLDDREQLLTILKQDPFYIHGIADFEIIEFVPIKYHPDFSNFVS